MARPSASDPSVEGAMLIWIIFAGDVRLHSVGLPFARASRLPSNIVLSGRPACFAEQLFAEMAFLNVKFMSPAFWVLLTLDFAMIILRDAELWTDIENLLAKPCGETGEKIASGIVRLLQMAGGDEDLAVQSRTDRKLSMATEASEIEASLQRVILSRIIASQAVASEFLVTGCFLVVSLSSYLLNESGFVAFADLIPLTTGVSSECQDGSEDPCVCDTDGAVGGVYTHEDGGCTHRDTIASTYGSVDASMLQPLCLVPPACNTEVVGNSTLYIRAALGSSTWSSPGTHNYRLCELGTEVTSDACDPGPSQVREQSSAFVLVLFAQCVALGISKVILRWKFRKFVRAAKTHNLRLQDVKRFEQMQKERMKAQKQHRSHSNESTASDSKTSEDKWAKFRRAGTKARVIGALGTSNPVESGGDQVSELDYEVKVAEAVSRHWEQFGLFYGANVLAQVSTAFFYVTFIISAQGEDGIE